MGRTRRPRYVHMSHTMFGEVETLKESTQPKERGIKRERDDGEAEDQFWVDSLSALPQWRTTHLPKKLKACSLSEFIEGKTKKEDNTDEEEKKVFANPFFDKVSLPELI